MSTTIQLTALENDFLGDLMSDSHELWEVASFFRTYYPDLSESDVVLRVRDLLGLWISRGWITIWESRQDKSPVSVIHFLNRVDNMGLKAGDPNFATFVFWLSERGLKEVEELLHNKNGRLGMMHDWTLKSVKVDWSGRQIVISVSWAGKTAEIIINDFSNVTVPRIEEWGPSVSINSVSEIEKLSSGEICLKIEMQTGDTILVTGREINLPSI